MEKKYNEKLTFEIANQRFIDQGRTDIQLCKDGYIGWKKKSKFFDLIQNDYFWSIPKNVYDGHSCHPKRSVKNRAKTNLEKYGNVCSLHGETTKEKVKKTNLERYGAEFIFQSKQIREKVRNTNMEKYGVENISQLEEIKQLKKQTVLNNFGVEHQMYSDNVKQKIKETCLEKYGNSSSIASETVKQKIKETCLEKYGVDHYNKSYQFKKLISKYIIKDTGEIFYDWYKNQSEPKPSYSNFIKFLKKDDVNLTYLNKVIKDYKSNKTQLEVLGENLFNSIHYNKKPEQIQKNYRPDFKLSDTVYVNVDGLYWHSEEQKGIKYHFELRKHFEENNLRLFQFYENEIKNKPEIVKSIVNNSLGQINNKIYARKCEIKTVNHQEAVLFLNKNHLMGQTNAKHIGLYYQQKLVSLISFKEIKNICKIERFCSLIDFNIIGGFSKLLKHIESNLLKSSTSEIHNWVDLRYGTGKHLENKGFKLIKETLGWKWCNGVDTYNRLYCKANMDERKLTEAQHAEELFLFKLYDAGQRLYVKKLNS